MICDEYSGGWCKGWNVMVVCGDGMCGVRWRVNVRGEMEAGMGGVGWKVEY